DGVSTKGMPQEGALTARDSAICTLSKLTKRSKGWAFFQSTMGGASTLLQLGNQFVLATWRASVFTRGQTAGITSSSTHTSNVSAVSVSCAAVASWTLGEPFNAFSRSRFPLLTSRTLTGAGT